MQWRIRVKVGEDFIDLRCYEGKERSDEWKCC